jgi:hypothetical protein
LGPCPREQRRFPQKQRGNSAPNQSFPSFTFQHLAYRSGSFIRAAFAGCAILNLRLTIAPQSPDLVCDTEWRESARELRRMYSYPA